MDNESNGKGENGMKTARDLETAPPEQIKPVLALLKKEAERIRAAQAEIGYISDDVRFFFLFSPTEIRFNVNTGAYFNGEKESKGAIEGS